MPAHYYATATGDASAAIHDPVEFGGDLEAPMSDPPWVPLSRRGNPPAEAEVPDEGIPPQLAEPLWRWIKQWVSNPEEILLAFRIAQAHADDPWSDLADEVFQDDQLFLDVIDFVLGRIPIPHLERPSAVKRLRWLLERGGSAWRVADDGRALERRIDPTVAEAVRRATVHGTSAAEHLTAAWRAVYGRQPDPGKAYGEAIKAVEAAAIPIVEPRNTRATLGTVLGTLKAQSDNWELAILRPDRTASDAKPLVAMIELLRQGQSDRHGGSLPTVPISAQAAPMAVHLSATLVHWFSSGAVGRKS
jgi:hypothetical protein